MQVVLQEFLVAKVTPPKDLKHVGDFKYQLEDSKADVESKDESSHNYHYQGYLQVAVKIRVKQLAKEFHAAGFRGAHLEPAVSGKALADYCTKKDTRIAGPWGTDGQIADPYDGVDFLGDLYPFQKTIKAQAESKFTLGEDTASINILYDPKGVRGKSFTGKYLRFMGKVGYLQIDTAANLRDQCLKIGTQRMYIFDISRTISKEYDMTAIYQVIEQIRTGYLSSNKNTFREMFMQPPLVWVFTNRWIESWRLSQSRPQYYMIGEDNSLLHLSKDEVKEYERKDGDKKRKASGGEGKSKDSPRLSSSPRPSKKAKQAKDHVQEESQMEEGGLEPDG